MPDVQGAIDTVMEFTSRMNELQEKIAPRLRKKDADTEALLSQYRKDAMDIMVTYFTTRKRSYPLVPSDPPIFRFIDEQAERTVVTSGERVNIDIQPKNGALGFRFCCRFQFNRMRIDLVKALTNTERDPGE